MPIGTEIAMPTAVEVTVIVRLSDRPCEMSLQRLTKSGTRKPCTKRQPRSSPSAIRVQLNSTLPIASTRYTSDPA